MVISTLLASVAITLIPYGGIIPINNTPCGQVVGVFNPNDNKIYICEGYPEQEFTKYHELGHYFYVNHLTAEQREEYHTHYEKSKKRGKLAFLREYGYLSEQEDFADNFGLLALNIKQRYPIQKRINLVKKYIDSK